MINSNRLVIVKFKNTFIFIYQEKYDPIELEKTLNKLKKVFTIKIKDFYNWSTLEVFKRNILNW